VLAEYQGSATHFDAIVIGGGPAGCAAAITLVRAGWSVLVLERQAGVAFRVGESLPPAAQPLLRDLGLGAILHDGHLPSYGNQSAWGSAALWHTDFMFDPHGHGWRLDRWRFDAGLRAIARSMGAQVREGVRVRTAMHSGHGWVVATDQQQFQATWVIDCTGRAAWLARSQGARMRRDDRLVAFVVRFRDGRVGDQDTHTLVEAAADGWWYSALLPNGERVVVFHCDAGSSVAQIARSPVGYAELLAQTEHIRARLERWQATPIAEPLVLAAGSTYLNLVHGQGWIAAGDAAQAFDPLASRGIASALYAGMQAAQALIANRQGDNWACARYAEHLQAIYTGYVRSKSEYYALEQRWADRAFWADRSG